MFLKLTGCAAAAAIAALLSVGPSQAAMTPTTNYGDPPPVHHVDCAVGFHIGPAGACVLGTEERHDDLIEHRSVDEGCQTKTVHKENGMGDSETRTKTNCD
jgi:hypothetical protein